MDKKIDVFAFGITIYELLKKGPVWGKLTNAQIRATVIAGGRPEIGSEIRAFLGEQFKFLSDIVVQCWNADPYARPRFKMIELKLREEMHRWKIR